MASDDDDLGDLRAKIDRKAENAWFGKYRSFCVTFGTFENLRNVLHDEEAGDVAVEEERDLPHEEDENSNDDSDREDVLQEDGDPGDAPGVVERIIGLFGTIFSPKRMVRVDDKAGGVKNPRNLKEEEEESPLLKLFQTPDFIDIFFGDYEKHDKGFAERGAKYDVLANERVGKGALLNKTDLILLACASEKIRLKLLEHEKTKNFVKNAILLPFEMRNPIIAPQTWYAFKKSAVMINATERKRQKLTYDFCNALDRNPYDPTLLAFLVREANIDYVSRAQRMHAQETRGNLFKALTGGDPSTVQVVPSFYFSEQGYSDSEEEEAALEEWKEFDAQIPVMTPEIWNTLPQEVRDQGLSMMNAINAMGLIDGFAQEAATQRAGTAAQTTTKEKKKNAEKEQQKPKKKKDNPFRGMFDR